MTKREQLLNDIRLAEEVLSARKAALAAFDEAPENNVFDNLQDALDTIEGKLYDLAHQDCKGSYNCGNEFYTQKFIVDGVVYEGTLHVEYNRHDKTYYYVDETQFTYEEITG